MSETYTLEQVLGHAVKECKDAKEEEGGVIIRHSDDHYQFIKLRNQNTGTEIAPVLWTADRNEYAQKVMPLFFKGWRQFASFHTHPQFLPFPSNIDLTQLFPGFSIDYIYSQKTREITKWSYTPGEDKNHCELIGAYAYSRSFGQLLPVDLAGISETYEIPVNHNAA